MMWSVSLLIEVGVDLSANGSEVRRQSLSALSGLRRVWYKFNSPKQDLVDSNLDPPCPDDVVLNHIYRGISIYYDAWNTVAKDWQDTAHILVLS